jgi:hypothetical protein
VPETDIMIVSPTKVALLMENRKRKGECVRMDGLRVICIGNIFWRYTRSVVIVATVRREGDPALPVSKNPPLGGAFCSNM